jgi:ABC transporter substrate binding protein
MAARTLSSGMLSLDAMPPGQRANGAVSRMTVATLSQRACPAGVIGAAPSVFLNLKRLADLALQSRLPAVSVYPQFAEAGGLMGYGPNLTDLFRQAANYVDRVLKGTRPAELPIQRPAVFKLIVNLRTAKALGLTIPPSLLLRADQVIE